MKAQMEGQNSKLLYAAKHPRLREVVNPTYYPIFRSFISSHILRKQYRRNPYHFSLEIICGESSTCAWRAARQPAVGLVVAGQVEPWKQMFWRSGSSSA